MKSKYSATLLAVVAAMMVTSLPVLASNMDDSIETSARQSHVFKTYLKSDDIKVEAEDGTVTLTGTVEEASHKSLAEDTVAGLSGVKSVDNKLAIKADQPTEYSDAWLMTKVKTTLLFHRNVSAMTEVSAKEGVVTLQGKASSQAEKSLTTEYALDIEGVKKVNNEMSVSDLPKNKATLGEKIDDASITAEVKMVLLSHRSTSAVHTRVETKNGVVTLSGKAKNAAEIDLVTKYVNDINGVHDVKNQMSIEQSK
ncbi:MAG: transport-associated protein [Zetaproteobacteria bacterium CG_4_9_14_3_um_filter_49_83]|nr:MAG: transport-associated protein [Zetaproteobacteria bacterium CG1_02_49_23]PIQ30370.1 MAG: transport-associated protein [Zetaproteobacteria bacterium CG17_big_fil_post_rev_8_21_14_2_50_50_13]PIV29701.1 MAG: transport-associated protein [Zetaproteobacteria bacterium CG02_land_8_20_14_3_00_50_9]PIY54734.1 MAG: transport-associated protein [Zetaproteobacteria bacterium CG_4_10_14_0_8_um_filter_49_80]PJA34122.1 MAG: transport-associated protein [Zetaproteobacteria bacterium CG_4_9_14_3_um_filt